jgi:hypothetical protein
MWYVLLNLEFSAFNLSFVHFSIGYCIERTSSIYLFILITTRNLQNFRNIEENRICIDAEMDIFIQSGPS